MTAETTETIAQGLAEDAPTGGGGAKGFWSRLPLSVRLWLIGYVVLFVLYIGLLHWAGLGWRAVEPEAWVATAFPETVTGETDLERMAELAQSEAHRDAALVRVWQDLTFESHGGLRHTVVKGHRLTAYEAGALAKTILADQNRPEETEPEVRTLILYEENALARLPWAYLLKVYNLLGLFLLLRAFAWGAMRDVLDEKAGTARTQLAQARAALEEAERLSQRRQEILREAEAERARLKETATTEFAQERERIIAAAKTEAESLIDTLRSSLSADVQHATADLRRRIVREAVAEARDLLRREAAPADHEAALRSLLGDLEKVDLR
jgi:F-type H+-transporting ATPase subunit b